MARLALDLQRRLATGAAGAVRRGAARASAPDPARRRAHRRARSRTSAPTRSASTGAEPGADALPLADWPAIVAPAALRRDLHASPGGEPSDPAALTGALPARCATTRTARCEARTCSCCRRGRCRARACARSSRARPTRSRSPSLDGERRRALPARARRLRSPDLAARAITEHRAWLRTRRIPPRPWSPPPPASHAAGHAAQRRARGAARAERARRRARAVVDAGRARDGAWARRGRRRCAPTRSPRRRASRRRVDVVAALEARLAQFSTTPERRPARGRSPPARLSITSSSQPLRPLERLVERVAPLADRGDPGDEASAVSGARGSSTSGSARPGPRRRSASPVWSPWNGYDSIGTPAVDRLVGRVRRPRRDEHVSVAQRAHVCSVRDDGGARAAHRRDAGLRRTRAGQR